MPVLSRDDAAEVESRVARVFAAASPSERVAQLRALFVEVLDFAPASGQVGLDRAPRAAALPHAAERIAHLDGVHVLYVPLDTKQTTRVRKEDAANAARIIAKHLGEDILLVFTNAPANQLHFILPQFDGARPTLRRMVVERDLPRRTAVQQVSNIYWRRRDSRSIRTALNAAFDVEAVTRKFFAEYKRVFDFAMERVQGFGSSRKEQEDKKLFVQTLFNRLMFIYFLSKKGWLTFQGDSDYLNALWNDHRADDDKGENFHADRLHHLFFFGLNNLQSRDLNSKDKFMELVFGEVPFLNGGLFEQTKLDKRDGVTVPDGVIQPILTDLFDRFNFTVMESTPFDVEVAVDPEMLGKVFEELVTGRRGTGSYYTPRPVVAFMCREALKGYLEGCDTGLTEDDIARFVDERDTSGLSTVSAGKVAVALERVTAVDPACGSGAYLLGMMQELVELRTTLFNVGVTPRSLYQLKLHVIQRNLYGADIDEFAVNIAMLRMWLSLAIEYEGEKPEPLPNLDFKVVRGDSLLGPDPSPDNYGDLFRHRAQGAADELASLKAKYMDAAAGKETLKAEIERVQDELRDALADAPAPNRTPESAPVLDWRVEFAEVFDQGGFDVALANPPYIQLQKDGGKLGTLYRGAQYETFARTGDVYQLFYERGCQLLRSPHGTLAYITSNSWLKAEYGKPLRRYFSEKHEPLALLELGKDVFDSAIVDSCVLLLRKGSANGAFRAVDMDRLPDGKFPPNPNLWGRVRPDHEAPWSILSLTEHSVMDKMRTVGTPLAEWDVKINYGIKTGYNKAFIIDGETRQALIDSDPNSEDIIKPILRGRDILRYRVKWAELWFIATHNGYGNVPAIEIDDYPAVKAHLDCHYPQLAKRQDKGRTPYNLRNCAYYEDFTKEKLFWIDLTEYGRFAYYENERFCVNTAYMITGTSIKYLCAVLNSNLITWYVKNTALNSGMGVPRWVRFTVGRLPIPKTSVAEQRPFVRLVDSILDDKAARSGAYTGKQEREIDRLVYDLYGLTEEEVTAIERRLGLIHATDEKEDAALSRAIEEGLTAERVSGDAVKALLRAPDGD